MLFVLKQIINIFKIFFIIDRLCFACAQNIERSETKITNKLVGKESQFFVNILLGEFEYSFYLVISKKCFTFNRQIYPIF